MSAGSPHFAVFGAEGVALMIRRVLVENRSDLADEELPQFKEDQVCSITLRCWLLCMVQKSAMVSCLGCTVCSFVGSRQVLSWPSMRIKRGGEWHTVHARRMFHGRPRYDFVHVRGHNAEAPAPWLARLLALVTVEIPEQDNEHVERPGHIALALIQWLHRGPDDELVPGIREFHYLPEPQAIEVDAIMRPVWLVENPVRDAVDDTHHLCALPYGKSCSRNMLF